MCFILWLVVGCVHVVTATCQARIHDGEVLVRQSQIDDQFGLVAVEEFFQLVNIIGINLCCFDVHFVTLVVNALNKAVAFLFVVTCDHKLCEDVLILDNLECANGSHATCANH